MADKNMFPIIGPINKKIDALTRQLADLQAAFDQYVGEAKGRNLAVRVAKLEKCVNVSPTARKKK